MQTHIYKELFGGVPKENINLLNEHNLEIRSFNKLHSTLFSFKNLNSSYQTFEVDFKGSQNLLIRGGNADGSKTIIKVEGEESTII
jgi:hypothetical protein